MKLYAVSSRKIAAGALSLLVILPVLGLAAFSGQVVTPVKAGGGPISVPVSPSPSTTPVTPPTQGGNNGGNGGGNGGGGSAQPKGCNDARPTGTPDLFQIDRNGKQATLHFTPVQGNVTGYNVIYGFKEGEERFGALSMTSNHNQGVQSITISHLAPGKTYAFKVAPVNGCAVGEWSNWLTVKGQKNKFFRYFSR